MSDDWEDEDFVPILPNAGKIAGAGEEDLLEKELAESSAPRPVDEAAIKRKEEAAEAAFKAKLQAAKEDNETPDQRRLRERRQIEEADHGLTNELFDKDQVAETAKSSPKKAPSSAAPAAAAAVNPSRNFSSSGGSGLGSIPLASNQDHFEFGNLVSVKLSDSTSFNIGAFYKGLAKVFKQNNVSVETLDEILVELNKAREAKAAKDGPKKKGDVGKKSQKEVKKENKRHEELFGFAETNSKYSGYDDIEDDFM